MNYEIQRTFDRAVLHLSEMRSAEDMDALKHAWADYLTYFRRTWFKCLRAYRGTSWWGPLEQRYKERWESEPVASYLRHARNADEHGIEPVAVVRPGFTVVSGGVIVGPAKIVGGASFTLGPGSTAKVKVNASTVVATAVVDEKGVTHHPPTLDGNDSPPVLRLAEEGLSFYGELFEEIRRELGP